MLKAVHAQEDREAAVEKAQQITAKLEALKLVEAAAILKEGYPETLTYCHFPRPHWRSIKTNNPMERIMREIRRRTNVVGNFPDGKSALMLVSARLRYLGSKAWGTKRYLNMEHLRGWEVSKASA